MKAKDKKSLRVGNIKRITDFMISSIKKSQNKGVDIKEITEQMQQKNLDEAEKLMIRYITGKKPEKITQKMIDGITQLAARADHLSDIKISPEKKEEKWAGYILRTRDELVA